MFTLDTSSELLIYLSFGVCRVAVIRTYGIPFLKINITAVGRVAARNVLPPSGWSVRIYYRGE